MTTAPLPPNVISAIDSAADELTTEIHECLQWLHDHPEISGEEYQSSRYLANRIASHGFTVTHGTGGLPTAFKAERIPAGADQTAPSKPAVAFLAEYDALPVIGHGCGHNMIGTVGAYSGIVLARAFPDFTVPIRIYGTPAEETFGGKITMLEAGAFEGVGCALMMHPGLHTEVAYTSLASIPMQVEFTGKPAHAAASPWKGINALDAMIQLFVTVSQTLKQLPSTARMPGIITHGGDAPNIVPERTAARFSLRGATIEEARVVRDRWLDCVEAAARATGCSFTVAPDGNEYADMRPDETLAKAFDAAWSVFGDEPPTTTQGSHGSLDIGNLSHHFPCLHPSIRITFDSTIGGHTTQFRDATLTDYGKSQMLRAIKALAATGWIAASATRT